MRSIWIGLQLSGLALIAGGVAATLTNCSTTTNTKLVADGQLFCAKATTDGPLVVALADALGAPVIVTGLASDVVAADCAAINAIPVTQPAAPAAAPVVAVALPKAPAS